MLRAHTPHSVRVIIIGAGTGGLSLAQGLDKFGISYKVFDKDISRTGGLQGYRISVSPDGCRALDDNLPAALYETFISTCGIAPTQLNIMTERFGELLSLDMSSPENLRYTERSVSRMTLRQVLLTGIEDHVEFGKSFSRYVVQENGEIEVIFDDGSRETCDILVGADGTNSRVRQQYLPDARLSDTLIRTIGGKVPATDYTRSLLTPEMRRGITLLNAPQGFGGIVHNMEFPWDENGAPKGGIGASDATTLTQWPGLLFDNTRDYIMWGFWAKADKFPENLTSMRGARLLALSQAMTSKWHPDWCALLAQTDPNSVFPIAVRTSEPVNPWKPSRITLIGDAIHTMTPGRGAGANTALRDAALLTMHLDRVRNEPAKTIDAISRYEREMRAYSAGAVARSRAQMNAAQMVHRPFIGRLSLAAQRASMRVINNLPAVKKRMARTLQKERSQDA